MSKRQKLDYNSDELGRNLKLSTGKGVDALFSGQSPTLPTKVQSEVAEQQVKQIRKETSLPPIQGQAQNTPLSESTELPTESTEQPTIKVTNERTNETTLAQRKKTRHTFDIFADQLLSLKEIQLAREKAFGKKYRIGDLAQEALDLFITRERNKE